MRIRHFINLFLLMLLASFIVLSTTLYFAGTPSIADMFNVANGQVQLSIMSLLAGVAVVQLIFGPIADRFGRKPILLITLFVYCLATLFCLLANDASMLKLARFFQTVAAAGCLIIAIAIVADHNSKNDVAKYLAYFAAFVGVLSALLPIVGGYLEFWFGLKAIFIVLFSVGIIAIFLTFVFLPESLSIDKRQHSGLENILKLYPSLVKDKSFITNVIILTLAFSAFFVFILFSPFIFLNDMDMNVKAFGVLLIFNALSYVFGGLISARFVNKWGCDMLTFVGTFILLLSGLLMLFMISILKNEYILMIPLWCSAFALAMINASANAAALERFPYSLAIAQSFLQSIKYGIAVLVALLLLYFSHLNILLLSTVVLLFGFTSMILAILKFMFNPNVIIT